MSDLKPQPHVTPKPAAGYEKRDASFKGMLAFAIVLAVFVGVMALAAFGVFKYFAKHPEPGYPVSPLAAQRTPYAGPKLQVNGPAELRQWRAAEAAALNGYAWVDPDKGIVRIPIGQAIAVLAEHGLPVKIDGGGKQ